MPWFLITFIFFALWLNRRIALNEREEKIRKAEHNNFIRSNLTSSLAPSRPLDSDMFIHLSEKDFPFRSGYDETRADEYELSKLQKKVLHHLSAPLIKPDTRNNIELKRRYGADNLQVIADGEENFTRLMQFLNKWAAALIKSGNTMDAERILKKMVDSGSDISETYRILIDLYKTEGRTTALDDLYSKIDLLPDPLKKRISTHQ